MAERQVERVSRSTMPGQSLVWWLDRLLQGADLLAKAFVGLALLAITLTLFVGALGRYALDFSFVGGEELARYLMVWMTFLGSYVLVREQRHIMIDIVLRMVPPPVQRWIAVLIGTVGLVTMLYITKYGYALAERMLTGFQMSPVLPIPRGLLHVSLPLGSALMAMAFLHMALSHLLDPRNARPLFTEQPADQPRED
ncbi:TRAP transporter small permease subunit [Azospirillum brasilense]|uniref:TRAP transporter small permease n=1 Tax=Azospirillum brasilense TaxID=192 RepID=UPI001909112B|nr:TRAP transporter small permease [Azospirillum brasilense]MBK3734183.1 TRAP transporter small permease subunit [Azospirillum brasilense]